MRISLTMPVRTIAVAAVALVVAAGGGYAVASTTGGGAISACAKKSNGALRLATKCQKSERKVSWSIQGPTGAPGSPGAPGQNGVSMFARVDDLGALQRHSAGVTASRYPGAPTGTYAVVFPRSVAGCVPVVSDAQNANNSYTAGAEFEALVAADISPTLNPDEVVVSVTVYNSVSTHWEAADSGFDLIVAC